MSDRRAPVRAYARDRISGKLRKGQPGAVPGTIAWAEHEEAFAGYDKLYDTYQTVERIAERGGFIWDELVLFLGHEPTSWEPRR